MLRRILTPLLLSMLLLAAAAAFAAELPEPNPPARAKCPVCAMFVGKFPDWAVEVEFRQSGSEWFDGPKDMFKCILDMREYLPAKVASPAVSVRVRDYYSLKFIDGRKAYYVIGSDVAGPMGPELVPFGKPDDAKGFMADHGGKRVLRFDEVTPAVIKSIE